MTAITKYFFIIVATVFLLISCSNQPLYASPERYSSFDCNNLATEYNNVKTELSKVPSQPKVSGGVGIAGGSGGGISTGISIGLNFGGSSERSRQKDILNSELNAIRNSAKSKNCPPLQ